MGSHVARMEEGKPTGKRPLGRPWHRWEDNIRIDLEEIIGAIIVEPL